MSLQVTTWLTTTATISGGISEQTAVRVERLIRA
jgi:hypothetical protein